MTASWSDIRTWGCCYAFIVCIVQLPIYIHLLTITHLHNKAAVATKDACKSICLGLQNTADASIIMLITQAADAINFA